MSHSSGINVSKSLSDAFGAALQGDSTRFFQVQITESEESAELVVISKKDIVGSFDDDLQYITELLEERQASYFLYRLDEPSPNGKPHFIFFVYVPDRARVRQKMIYASTRANLKRQLGAGNFKYEIFGTVKDDFTADGYAKWMKMQLADVPLTEEEMMKEEEEEGGIYVGGASTYVHGIAFPVDQAVHDALNKLKAHSVTYVQIKIDAEGEKLVLGDSCSIGIGDIAGKVSGTEPLFHLFNWDHTYNGDALTSCVFIYSCPDGSGGTKAAPVRLRMLYSSSKSNCEGIAKESGLVIAGKLEVNRADEVSEESINELIHPPLREKKEEFCQTKRTKP
mmetsp:Transcript_18745/g.20850  ORF Transcript_18745/g.20850 Transcript_18745/m.20850 type:complete len:337 (+) Transcript_18745:26-1036(+)